MKKIYKIIASISVFFVVLFVGVVLVVGNTNKKANAGVIIEEQYIIVDDSDANINNLEYYGALTGGSQYINMIGIYNQGARVYDLVARPQQFDGGTVGLTRAQIQYQRYTGAPTITSPYTDCFFYEYDNNVYFMFSLARVRQDLTEVGYDLSNITIDNAYHNGHFFKASATIAPCSNIYDLENKNFCLLYLSDISGLSTTQQRDEITINWGYIDQNDNTLYAEYTPTIKAQNLSVDDDTIIRLVVPLNNNGSTMDYYDISQRALLSTIDSSQGGATATAHIYGVYVWRSENMIEWGLAEFDTTSTPTSGATMNYLTSTTRLFQYQNMGTSTMTCRLSVSSNFNFITIKNQDQVNVSSVNEVIRRGGFMPAWSLYNWARGSHSGFTSGEQYGTAQYQPGTAGYNAIYQAGRQAGINENIGTQSWFVKIFEGVDAFLNIRIFPNITFGVLLGIPFVISVVWFIIRSFRGGGGS